MTRKAKDWGKCLIYKIECKDKSVKGVFYSYTTVFATIKNRHKNAHKKPCVNCYKELYNKINANGGWDNWIMSLVEYYPCKNNLEVQRRVLKLCTDKDFTNI